MNYEGTIIEESLSDKSILDKIRIVSKKIEPITDKHQTPWLKQWTLDKVDIPEEIAEEFASRISIALDFEHKQAWYVDYRNDKNHYVIFSNKIFKIERANKEQYDKAIEYGIALGIPDSQMKPIAKYLNDSYAS
ncbi:MAG: hypothetical protein ABI643_03490 [Candidatus Doudnabacteria bacterium]